ncbi:MAG TPA: hypothetical protein VFU03_00435 [Gemmatimonadales bacterium]|nr:hypothetical protein [Gemmatimonadales bacterium]
MRSVILPPLTVLTMATIARIEGPSFTAEITGEVQTILSGNAVFGPVRGPSNIPGSFSLTLGAYSDNGAVVFSRVASGQPKPGTYRVTAFTGGAEKEDELHALISLGSASNPLGAFRGMSGTVTITQSSPDRIVGRYDLHAVGFMAADMNDEEREITVRGSFAARASATPSTFRAAIRGAVGIAVNGESEFGTAWSSEGNRFSLTMGTNTEAAVVLSRNVVARPGTGVYHITPETMKDDGAFHGVVVTGEPSHPTGVFRIKSGMITVTSSSVERMSGTFEMQAEGFLATDMDNETRTVTVSGSFSATPSAPSAPLTLKQ